MLTVTDIKELNLYINRKYPTWGVELMTNGKELVALELASISGDLISYDTFSLDSSIKEIKTWLRNLYNG
jgi:MoaA/NifB/PqqE/SkfB family radical SAM enzyme